MNSSGSFPSPHYERTIGSPGLVVLAAGALVVSIVVVLLVAAMVSRHHAGLGSVAPAQDTEFSFTHGPYERTSIARDWIAQDAAVHDHLETYGWNDRAAGIVRVPIERAMELVGRDAAAATQRKDSP